MNPKTQELLKAIAMGSGFTIEFPDGAPIRLSGFPNGQVKYVNPDQPESDLVFAVLHTIGSELDLPLPMPWFLNRPYENERVGDAAYKIKRAQQIKRNKKWRADIWALLAYSKTIRYDLLSAFLIRHPDKLPAFFWTWVGMLFQRFIQIIKAPGRILHSLFHSASV